MENYSNRELDLKIDIIKQHITDIHKFTDDKLERITKAMEDYAYAKKEQNGRVSKLESWRNYLVGAVSALLATVLPAIGWLFYVVVNHLTDV